jgi:hypothetical protein
MIAVALLMGGVWVSIQWKRNSETFGKSLFRCTLPIPDYLTLFVEKSINWLFCEASGLPSKSCENLSSFHVSRLLP